MRPHFRISAILPLLLLYPLNAFAATEEEKAYFDSLLQISGPAAKHCGFVPLGEDAGPALKCAQVNSERHAVFDIAIQVQGIDSTIWEGAAQGSDGRQWLVTFDSNTYSDTGYSLFGWQIVKPKATPARRASACADLRFSLGTAPRILCGSQP